MINALNTKWSANEAVLFHRNYQMKIDIIQLGTAVDMGVPIALNNKFPRVRKTLIHFHILKLYV
jgi:hypothetical protein